MKNDMLDQLIESREQLTRLKAIACRMAHERVLIDRRTQSLLVGTVPEIEFERACLCEFAKRFKNPACSHTIARYPIEKRSMFWMGAAITANSAPNSTI
jgi:hypothetical protein